MFPVTSIIVVVLGTFQISFRTLDLLLPLQPRFALRVLVSGAKQDSDRFLQNSDHPRRDPI